MDKKKRNLVLVNFIVLIIGFTNTFLMFKFFGISGMAVNDISLSDLGGTFSKNFSPILLTGQWLLIIIIMSFSYLNYFSSVKEEKTSLSYDDLKKSTKGSSTDIDVLYTLLKDRKSMKVRSVAHLFKINEEKALEWCKILEGNNLVIINYPAFSGPEVELKEDEDKKSD
jgi:hypothetical protein